MRRIIYASRAVLPFSDVQLVELLSSARLNNLRHDVTGMLVYASESFLQQFEGEDEAVEVVWDRIRMDDRHRDLRVIADGPTAGRQFSDWSMGFAHASSASLEEVLPGYRASLHYPFVSPELIAGADTAETLLSLYSRLSD